MDSSAGGGEFPGTCQPPEVIPLDEGRFTVPVNGGLVPCLVSLTLVTNGLVCAVLLRQNMRTPTNTLLLAMAVSDVLTGVWPLPCFVHLYTLGAYTERLSYWWCRLYYWLTEYLPTVFHTASVWLTVALAAERYIHVCHMLVAKNLCTVRNMVRVGRLI
jgi:thyrotropin-releasing hormone receptor